jgi:D-arabinose 5-phosphate isomerase GutQ
VGSGGVMVSVLAPHNLAPTSSTTVALTMGDALAVSLLNEKGFSLGDNCTKDLIVFINDWQRV